MTTATASTSSVLELMNLLLSQLALKTKHILSDIYF